VKKLRRSVFVTSGVVAALLAVALVFTVSAFGRPAQAQKTNVSLTAGKPSEFRFTPAAKTVTKGVLALTVTFVVTNRGTVAHDFKIAGKKTLLIQPGKSRTLSVRFTKTGKYPFICTLPSHALSGMKGTLTVKRS
jgi:uncharacterized cupredoxin-like copper-binding protein